MRIGELAARSGVSVRALRYYEEQDLLISTRSASGQRHYPVMVVLHTALLVSALAEVWILRPAFHPALGWSMLALVLASQALRWWCIATLGRRWNTRVIVVPGLPLVAGGPYRLLPHPNYVAVVVEGFALPLVHSAWITALDLTVDGGWTNA